MAKKMIEIAPPNDPTIIVRKMVETTPPKVKSNTKVTLQMRSIIKKKTVKGKK